MAPAEASSQVPNPRDLQDSRDLTIQESETPMGWEVNLPPHQIPQHRIVTVNNGDCLLQQFRGQDGIDPTLPPMVNPRYPKDSQAKGFQEELTRTHCSSFYRERLVRSMGEVCLTYLAAPPSIISNLNLRESASIRHPLLRLYSQPSNHQPAASPPIPGQNPVAITCTQESAHG